MTPKEQRYLFYAIYFTVQGLFLICALSYCIYKLKKTGNGDWGHAIAGFAVAKFMNSFGFIYNWGRFIDPEGG